MTDGDALLRAVLESPADDAPRLIYADWLEEHGDAGRAEFIRLQCQLARWPVEKCDSIYPGCTVSDGQVVWHDHKCPMYAVDVRARDLLDAHFGAWTDFLPESLTTKQCLRCEGQSPDWETNVVECRHCDSTGVVPDQDRVTFRRGFVERLEGYSPADRTAINGMWYWFAPGRNALGDWTDASHLPREVFDMLPGAGPDTIGLPFTTADLAYEALSAGLLVGASALTLVRFTA